MSNLLKDIYNREFYDNLSGVAGEVIPSFDPKQFKQLIFDSTWENKELKQRMRHTALVLNQFMPQNFEQAAIILKNMVGELTKRSIKENSLGYMFLPDYIELFGINYFESSVALFEYITPFASCEFAVRPFIIKYPEKMMRQMLLWSLHDNHHVRRLASEGSRPRLPWAIALPELKKKPDPILPLLENLKTDSSEYVRRSVANNLNDIAKDNPHIVVSIARKWKGISPETDAIIKHGCRTLLKKAHPEILGFYGLNDCSNLVLSKLKIHTPKIKIGDNLSFSFTIHNQSDKIKTVRLEYAVYYLLNNGKHTRKVYKISERRLQSLELLNIQRKQSFRMITTRKFYVGQHKLSIIINGKESNLENFELLRSDWC